MLEVSLKLFENERQKSLHVLLVPHYPVFRSDENWSDRQENGENWSNDYDPYYSNEDLPPNLMNIDFSSFDPSQLRAPPVSLINTQGQLTELDVNTRNKNFQDYKQRCLLLERLSWGQNENNYSNNYQDDYYSYDNYNSNNNR